MKTLILSKTLIILLLLPTLILGSVNPDFKGKHTKEKKIKKSFNVNDNTELQVDNSYGNLDIVTWSENRIEIEVTITVDGNNEEDVQKKLDDITINFEANSNMVSAKTLFNKNKSKSWWNWGGNDKLSMKINYVVKMPITNSVDLDNDYGNINLDKLEGRADIRCDYGKISTKELMHTDNIIRFDYSNNCYFEFINGGKIDADYSEFTVAKAKNIAIMTDYTKSNFEIIEDLTYDCDYGSLTIDKLNNIKGNGNYLTMVLGDIYKNVLIDSDYGSIKIKNITNNAKNITINSNYVGIHIGYDDKYSFSFIFDLEYGTLNSNSELNFLSQIVKSPKKYYEGYHISVTSDNLVKINSDYGSLTFNKN